MRAADHEHVCPRCGDRFRHRASWDCQPDPTLGSLAPYRADMLCLACWLAVRQRLEQPVLPTELE